jgi:nitrite reductase/ring-hydroxylating ferredoxin subunit/uncharacterized membrane protein
VTFTDTVESIEALDAPGAFIGKKVRGAIGPGGFRDLLSGRFLGHPLHPVLTDVVIGSFMSATLLDVLGGPDSDDAAERLIAIGIAAYGPTALTGVTDWADSEPVDDGVRRTGLVHAATNAAALTAYAASLAARRRGARGRGKLLGLAGVAALSAAGYLGGHLSFTKDVGPNQTAFDRGPSDWERAAAFQDVPDGRLHSATVGDTPVLLSRKGDEVFAIHGRCSHRGCSLAEGALDGTVVECGCHGSRFELRDGSVVRGPAFAPQPAYDARRVADAVEIRLRS